MKHQSMHPYIFVALIYLALTAPRSPAATVILQNGDRLSGDVEGLADSRLALKTAYAGTVRINWAEIAKLTGNGNNVMVEVKTGRRYKGTIEKTGERLLLQGENVRVELETKDVVSMVPLQDNEPPGFWRLLAGSVDLGYSFTRGNSAQTQSSAAAHAQYRTETYKAQARISSIFSETDDADPTSRHAADARLDRFISPNVFAFGLAGLERNERQNLDLRSKFGGGFGWTLADTERNQLNLLGGFTLTSERFRETEDAPDPNNTFGEGLIGVEWETVPMFNIRYSTKLSVHPNLVQDGRYRIEYDSSLRIPVLNAFTFSISLFDRYDSNPPTEVKRNDYGLVSAFGFAF